MEQKNEYSDHKSNKKINFETNLKMTKYLKESSSSSSFSHQVLRDPLHKISQRLMILSCMSNTDSAHKLLIKRRYFIRKLEFLSENGFHTPKFKHCKHIRRRYISYLDIDSNTYLKNLQLTKKLKSLSQFRCTVYTKEPCKAVKRVWKTICSNSMRVLKIEYPYLADVSVLFRTLTYHKTLEVLFYERLYSNFVMKKQLYKPLGNTERHQRLWEKTYSDSLRALRIYKSLFDQGNIEGLVFKSKTLQTLEIESNNETEDESLSKLIPKLALIRSLKALSFKFSECYTQQFLFNLLLNLQNFEKLQELTLFTPLCIPSPLSFGNNISLKDLQVLNLAISQTQRGHGHSEGGAELVNSHYEFFSHLYLPKLRHLAVVLENSSSLNSEQVSGELRHFLKFLANLSPTLESLSIQCYGSSLEYFEWEHILGVIGGLENLQRLELSEISYFNNFCLGMVSQTISKLCKLKRLYLKPVTVIKKRFLNLFVESILSHPSLDSLYLSVNKFSVNHTQSLLNKLKEFWLKTKFDGLKDQYEAEFVKKNKGSILGNLFYRFSGW